MGVDTSPQSPQVSPVLSSAMEEDNTSDTVYAMNTRDVVN